MLVDRAKINVKAGDGGNGSMSFRREKYVPMGGPDGGDGGRGGDVLLRVRSNVSSLLPFKYVAHFKADNGQAGGKRNRHGKNGDSRTVDVAPGTVVWDDATGEILADLTEPDEEVVVAKGGRGGLGNTHFKSATRQTPRLAELGEPGEERWLRLELRMIADVGLVGLPNAGKSTLLAASSAARPKVADYPFTTLEPNLGVVEVGGKGGQAFVMADIPGLIEGAAEGHGLGHEFLRHVTRTKVLVHVLDAAGGLEGRDPIEDFATINAELDLFDPDLPSKPMLVALNKVDLVEARDNLPRLTAEITRRGFEVFEVSAATGQGVPPLMDAVAAALREVALQAAEAPQKPQETRRYTIGNIDERAWEVLRPVPHEFVVTGIGIERFAKMTNFANDDAVERFQKTLDTSGIAAELRRQGVEDGDTVRIATHELVWGDQESVEPRSRRLTRRQRMARLEAEAEPEVDRALAAHESDD